MCMAKSCARAELPACTADIASLTAVLADWARLPEDGVLVGVWREDSPKEVLGRWVVEKLTGGGEGVLDRRLLTRLADSRVCRAKTCFRAYIFLP